MNAKIAFLLLLLVLTAAGQNNSSTLKGVIIDGDGALIPNALVSAIGKDGRRHSVKSDDNGRYELKVPAAGAFIIEIVRKPYKTFRIEEYQLIEGTLSLAVSLNCEGCERFEDVFELEVKDKPKTPLNAPDWIGNLRETKLFRPLRGLNILTTTRDEVHKLLRLKKPVRDSDYLKINEGRISIEYTSSECSYNGKRVPEGVVEHLSYQPYESNWKRFSALKIPFSEFPNKPMAMRSQCFFIPTKQQVSSLRFKRIASPALL